VEDEELSDVRIIFFRDDSSAPRELPQGPSCVARGTNERGGVAR
jgi:hypothetical protein